MKIIVTGGTGFLGKFVVKELSSIYDEVIPIGSKDFNLIHNEDVKKMYETYSPDVVVHLAAEVGGIGANMLNPGRFFYSNMSMGLNLIENARIYNLEKFVFVSTVCSYPKFTQCPFKESDIWNGYPEETNAPYGIAKKSTMVMLQGYLSQYGLKSCVLVPTNLYGPGDNFNTGTSHVVPALIKKIVEAKINGYKHIECWGDGSATREFLHAKDAARGVVRGLQVISEPDPINLGSGKEVRIRDLAEKIKELVGFSGDIVWDNSKPNGQPRRFLDTTKAKNLLGWKAEIDFEQGLRETIRFYQDSIESNNG